MNGQDMCQKISNNKCRMSPSSQFQVTVATNNYKHACDKSVILSQKKELTLKNK